MNNAFPANTRLPFLIALILALIVIAAAVAILLQPKNNTSLTNLNPGGTIAGLPINPSDKGLAWVYATYNFVAPIKQVKAIPGGTIITLNSTIKNIPPFVVTNTTQINKYIAQYGTTNIFSIPAAIPELQKNQQVTVIAAYNIQKKTWITQQINILPASTPITTNTIVAPSSSVPTLVPSTMVSPATNGTQSPLP